MSFTVSYSTKVRAQQHALNVYPAASFGLIFGEGYLPVSASSLAHLAAQAKEQGADAIVYSKPDQGPYPDAAEMTLQIETGLPFGVTGGTPDNMNVPLFWGDTAEIAPVIGRNFVHGIWDCYSLVRDVFRLGAGPELAEQRIHWPYPSIVLPNVPRNDAWWENGQDLYMDWLKPAGFVEVTAAATRPGDCFLMKIRSGKLNHAGMLVSDNEILHHLPTRLSRREVGGIWFRQIDKWLRYQG